MRQPTIYLYMKRQKKNEALSVKVTKDLKDELKRLAVVRDVSLGHIVRECILNNNKSIIDAF